MDMANEVNVTEILGDDHLPASIDFYLISLGFYKSDRAPGSKRNAKVFVDKPKQPEYVAWRPSFDGEQPPF